MRKKKFVIVSGLPSEEKRYWAGSDKPAFHHWTKTSKEAFIFNSKRKATRFLKNKRKRDQWLSCSIHIEIL